nr:MAG TPA: hypothetical protein [Caudoviricetes sp.]
MYFFMSSRAVYNLSLFTPALLNASKNIPT